MAELSKTKGDTSLVTMTTDRFTMKEKSLAHDRLVGEFDSLMNEYDISRRLEVLVEEFLRGVKLSGRLVLEAGCGTGRGSVQLSSLGASVIALDIGFNLVNCTRHRCLCTPIVASVLRFPFSDETFDIVFSTEVIEHTPDPLAAAQEMYRVLKPGGHLVLSTPNRLWQWPVRLASALGVRPYDGYENFISPTVLRRSMEAIGGIVVEHRGIHLFPFQLSLLHPILRRLDRFGRRLLPIMINQCLHCVKPAPG